MPKELFVAKIPHSVSVETLRELFEQAGTVVVMKRPRDHETGELRSFAFVTMETDADGDAAIEKLNGYELEGQPIVVKESDKPFQPPPARPAASRPARPAPPPPPPPLEFEWDDRVDLLEDLLSAPGSASTAKITVVGRPAQVEERGSTVMVMLQHFMRREGYPKGVPTPPDTPTIYLIFISAKQWKKVAPSLEANPDDILIVEGQAAFDPEIPGVSVFATGVNSKLLQAASRSTETEGG
jgi:hypothetical protein